MAFKIFRDGYIGVDIFLFFSGYGLCYSYKKSSLLDFYKKRVFRIAPLFILFAVFKSTALSTIGNETLSVWDWFCNITTLSYYKIGGVFIDWYLSALLLLYITFPIFRYIVIRTKLMGLIITTIICYLTLILIDFSWTHQCLIGRLPIFYFGILLYDATRNNLIDLKNIKFTLCFFLFFGIFSIMTDANKFLVSTLLTPFLLLICYLIWRRIESKEKILSIFQYLGSKSLEIYLGNCIALLFVRHIKETAVIENLYYFITTFIASFIFIKINSFISTFKLQQY